MANGYGDIEAILIGWLAARYTDCRVCTELPAELPAKTIQVVRIGGAPENVIPFELPRVDVDVYAGDRAIARQLAAGLQWDLTFKLPGYTAGDGTRVVAVRCETGPAWAPYDNTAVRRMTATYEFRTHNPL
jgi:hypothetical protein